MSPVLSVGLVMLLLGTLTGMATAFLVITISKAIDLVNPTKEHQ